MSAWNEEQQLQSKVNIRRWAKVLGFIAVGFTRAQTNYELEIYLKERQDKGLATPFEPLNHRLRCDPKAVWTECQTVVVLAYPLPLSSPPEKNQGILVRSSVGEDYHLSVAQRLKLLIQRIMENGWKSAPPKVQVDTGPLNERALAEQAGIGWLGRNQQLIVPKHGSFVTLSLLLLDQSFPPDPRVTEQCGGCQNCVQACPAQLLGGKPFAARDCLSYLTQSKEVLTAEQSNKLGRRLFGCDTCQEVCPHNFLCLKKESEKASVEPKDWVPENFPLSKVKLLNYELRRGRDLMEILTLTKRGFDQSYRPSAAGWRGKSILQRNAFLALVNADDGRLKKWLSEHKVVNDLPPILLPYLNK
ncbi:MAG: tRNA epoxyqueuosine(34) reductase QueG [Desulfitobacteriaceae bacterium]